MSEGQQLYVWLDRDPSVFNPDHVIDDIPGTADLDLLTRAILDGQFGDILPARIQISPHRRPETSRSVRTVDTGRLLRDLGIQHRRCYRIELPH